MIRREGRLDSRWVEGETAGCEFADVRLDRRFRELLAQIGDAVGASIPMACQDWANTKAAYRFFVSEGLSPSCAGRAGPEDMAVFGRGGDHSFAK